MQTKSNLLSLYNVVKDLSSNLSLCIRPKCVSSNNDKIYSFISVFSLIFITWS